MHARRISGFSLTELMVALGIAAFLMLVMTSLSTSDAKMHSRVRVAEYIQSYTISTIKTFANKAQFEQGFQGKTNPILDECRQNPCDPQCLKKTEWQPMTWDKIPIVKYEVNGNEVVDGGRYTLPKFDLCTPLPKTISETAMDPPRYAPECRASIKASWRASAFGTLEYRIMLRDNALGMGRIINHYESPYSAGRPHKCEMAKVVAYCKSPGAYLLSLNFMDPSLVCASPDAEVNY